MPRVRADRLLVERGLATDVEQAARIILAGEAWCGDVRVATAGELLEADAPLALKTRRNYVSRGGDKLAAALDFFPVAVAGRTALDAGCSTGGFTDCLLRRGAARVYAVDVGYGQFDWALRGDERVVLLERTNVRTLAPGSLEPRPDLVVADLAFVSLRVVLPALAELAASTCEMVLLVKPQFELAREEVKGGVVTDERLHRRAIDLVAGAARELGFDVLGDSPSPLVGPKGNREFFVALRRTARGAGSR